MFVKQIGCVLSSATSQVAQSLKFSRVEVVPLSVRIGRALAAAAVFVSPALVTPANAGGLTIADPGNVCASWSLNGSTLTCNAAVATPGAPSGCSLTANPSSIAAAANVTLTAACTSNTDSTTTWAWSANPSSAVTGLQASTTGASSQTQAGVNVSAATTFSVTATTGGLSTTKSAAVTFGGGGGGGGGGAGISCPGYTRTIVVNFPYVPKTGANVQTTDGMSTTDIVVATFKTPPAPYAGGTAFIQLTDNTPLSTGIRASVSTTPCSFAIVKKDTQSVSWNYIVKPDTQYYVNITGTLRFGEADGQINPILR
jgi:hypothetical protein